MTSAHLGISARISAPNSDGVPGAGSAPAFRMRSRTSARLSVSAISAFRRRTMLTGVFARKLYTGSIGGVVDGNLGQLGIQALGIVAAAAYSAVATYAILKVVAVFSPLRATEREQGIGLDVTEHGEEAYTRGDGALLLLRADGRKKEDAA